MVLALFLILLLAGCRTPLLLSPADFYAKRFEPVPGKGVIYIVRNLPDLSSEAATLMLDDRMMGTTYPGTYFRWVVEPGRHEIRGYAGDNGRFTLDVPPNGVYFVRQTVTRPFTGFAQSRFAPIPEVHGRAAVMRGEPIGVH